jgi:hypothetical protein
VSRIHCSTHAIKLPDLRAACFRGAEGTGMLTPSSSESGLLSFASGLAECNTVSEVDKR